MKLGALNRRTAARFTLLAWAIALAWLARRELGKTEAQQISEATIRLSPDAQFFAVHAGGRQIGYASVTVDTVPAGFSIAEVMALDVPERDSIRRFTRRTELILSRSLRLREFTRTLTGGGLFEELHGAIDGDSVLRFRQRADRETPVSEWSMPLTTEVVLPQVLPYRLAFGKRLTVGRTISANVLDLTTGLVAPAEFRATAESTFVVADSAVEQRGTGRWAPVTWDTVTAWRIEHQSMGTPMVTWVDPRGGLVRAESAFGVRLERSAFELVTFNYREALAQRGPDHHRAVPGMRRLVEAGAVPAAADGPVTVEIGNSPMERFLLPRLSWLEGGRQTVHEGRLRVDADSGAAPPDTTRTEYLGPPPGHERDLLVAARLAAGGARSRREIARNLVRWVAREIAIDTAHAAPINPRRVLAVRRAGAEGHARLFVELARGLDLTARPVSGVAVLPDGVFGHAWSEVWLDGRWVAVDPTFDHVPAPSGYLRATIGGSSRAIDLVPLLGSATFTFLEPVAVR